MHKARQFGQVDQFHLGFTWFTIFSPKPQFHKKQSVHLKTIHVCAILATCAMQHILCNSQVHCNSLVQFNTTQFKIYHISQNNFIDSPDLTDSLDFTDSIQIHPIQKGYQFDHIHLMHLNHLQPNSPNVHLVQLTPPHEA